LLIYIHIKIQSTKQKGGFCMEKKVEVKKPVAPAAKPVVKATPKPVKK